MKEEFMETREQEYQLPVPRKKSIYNISYEHQLLMQEIEDNYGEITPEIGEQLAITEKELQEKAVSYGYVMKQYDFEIDQINKEVERLQKLAKSKEKIQSELKERISDAMIRFGIQKIDHANLKLSFRKSEQLVIDDDAKIPKKFIKKVTTEKTDNAAIKKAVQEGEKITGIRVITKQNLQIK